MRKIFLSVLLSSLLVICFSCKQTPNKDDKKDKETTKQATTEKLNFEIKAFNKKDGPCKEAGGECVTVNLKYPFAKDGAVNTRSTINNFVHSYIIKTIDFNPDKRENTIEASVERFFKTYNKENNPMGSPWEIEIENKLYQTDKFATIELPTYMNLGGAHPNTYTAIANFNIETGQQIQFDDFVTDTTAMHQLASKYFLEKVSNLTGSTEIMDNFFFGKSFALPDNFGIKKDSIYFCYNPYEAAPYVFGTIDFTIPTSEMKEMINQAKL